MFVTKSAFFTNACASLGTLPAECTSNRSSRAQIGLSVGSYSRTVRVVSPADDVGEGGSLDTASREDRMEGVGGGRVSGKRDGRGRADREIESRGRAGVGPRRGVRRDEGELNIPPVCLVSDRGDEVKVGSAVKR